ncbi:MAG: hypothetical protein ACJ79K_13715 [Gemmatimonadaceae bacterium]
MTATLQRTLTAGASALMFLTVACADGTSPSTRSASLANALTLALSGNDQAQTSFVGAPSAMTGRGWSTDDGPHDGGGFMGGGLGAHFLGDDFSPEHRHGEFSEDGLDGSCAFNATSGRVECQAETHHGLTIVRSASYRDASGAVQQARDSATTNTINTLTTVTGTAVFDGRRGHHDDDGADGPDESSDSHGKRADTTTVALTSDRTVSGLASGSTARTVNAKSSGMETTRGSDSTGHFTIVRVAGDTTTGLLIPVTSSGPSYPTAGMIVRAMQATLTYDGATPASTQRREVITFDGSAVAKLVVTQDGTTKNCTIALPHGRPACQ